MKRTLPWTALTMLACMTAMAQNQSPEFTYLARGLGLGTLRSYTDSLSTNTVGGVYEQRVELNLRPDLYLKAEWGRLSAKPRLEVYSETYDETLTGRDNDSDVEAYLHEWRVRLNGPARTAIAYGREDKQWGPSYLRSPSNPFVKENGKNSPKTEVPAADYAELEWVARDDLTLTAIVNTDEGRRDTPGRPFERVYALKADWVGPGIQSSLIGAVQEEGDEHIGLHGTWNANDAVLVYTEIGRQPDDLEWLVGASYTFVGGGTVGAEYFYNESGGESTVAAVLPEIRADFPGEQYGLIQYLHPMLMERLEVTLRWVCNIDDSSHVAIALMDWAVGGRTELFVNGALFSGDDTSEFGSLLNHTLQIGLELTY